MDHFSSTASTCFAKYSKFLPCRKKEDGRKKTGKTIGFIKKESKKKGRGGKSQKEGRNTGKGVTVY